MAGHITNFVKVCALCGLFKCFAVLCATTRGTDFLLAEARNSVIMEEVWKSSFGHYDFSYLRIDFSTELNVGYAFVNFTHPERITNFVSAKVGKPWSLSGSTKRCEVSYATIQGIDCLLAKVRNRLAALSAAHHLQLSHAAP
ncbi:hypothetical protein D6D15_07269 [Aureobasidium pullulans]|uniref:Mei2-like C-terminal RNA recognition motif domain-containing protein n=1 Tax=Aureobasidium pullulans TaxID=5580 RepID=A0A4V4IUS5_AURPU|nr:hypothetical protein D6D15_07269 [Aureobasidium pullulans]